MRSDLRGEVVSVERDPRSLDEARRFEENGDAARDNGLLEFALVQYRRAAELHPGGRIAAKIAETAAACTGGSEIAPRPFRVLVRRSSLAACAVAGIAALVIALSIAARAPSGAKEPARLAAVAPIDPAPPPAVEPVAAPAVVEEPPASPPIVRAAAPVAAAEPRRPLKRARRSVVRDARVVTVANPEPVGSPRFGRVEQKPYPTRPAQRRMGLLQMIFG